MNETVFAIHLGGGLYMDSSGNLHQSQPPGVPVYDAPFQLPVDPKKVGSALNDIKSAMKDFTTDPDIAKKFKEWGVDSKLMILLSTVGKIAGWVAPVFFVLSFAIDIAMLFGWMKQGPDSFEELVKQRFVELEEHVHAVAELIHSKDLKNARIEVERFSARIKDYVAQLNNLNPSIAQLESDRVELSGLYNENSAGIASLMDVQTWLGVFDRDEYTRVWPWIEGVIFTHPGSPGEPPAPALLPPDGSLHLDHRLMVALASFAALSYIACIRGISPEYRTTGDFRADLKDFARKLDVLAQAMREHVLARTIYKPEHFSQPMGLMGWDVIDFPPFLAENNIRISPHCGLWPVGAVDLRYHDNTYFRGFLADLAKSENNGWEHRTKRGGMDFRWIPPATLQRHADPVGGGWRYTITNPEACAAAANAQSEKDYADLLAMSGYTELLLLATLFRNESTEPDKSQTVSIKAPVLYRKPQPSSQVAVESDDILMTGVITSTARREPQEFIGRVEVWTQPIKRARPLAYTVKLRTLASITSGKWWREPAYSSYHWTQYDRDLTDPGFLRLAIYTSDLAVDEHTLISGSSPRELRHAAGELEMKAHTFDWWIPVASPYSILEPFAETAMHLRALGQSDLGLMPRAQQAQATMQAPNFPWLNSANLIVPSMYGSTPGIFWQSGGQDWNGEHRDVKEAMVRVKYSLDWSGDRLHLTLENRPSDRNYTVYLVVEEMMPGTGQVLHTAMPVPVNGQLTYVPQKFFDDEREGYEQLERVVDDFSRRYSESVEASPLDQVIGWVRPGDFASSRGLERMVALAKEHQPELLRKVMAAHMRGLPARRDIIRSKA